MCSTMYVHCTQLRHTALADGGMTRVHPLGGAPIFKSCAPSVIFWALGIILRTGVFVSQFWIMRPPSNMAALAAAQDLKHQPLNHFHQSLHNHFSTLSSLHNSESVFHYKCVCVKIFCIIIMWNRWRKTKWTNFCVKNQLQPVSLNYNLAKKFLENLLRMEFDFDFFGLQ